ncbi:hypothetical protein PsYK624_093570 [Phanerochaete sordida]|uniref:MYND-type domain-containing protein n=1 Tax=Phanerochaete sordida TaxID=48140 RepID=A0A9P3GBT0_9APHY|nr:hypothetical protein PsYK624_093570 [Phanerochaete sordida]
MPVVPLFSDRPSQGNLLLGSRQMVSAILQHHMEPWAAERRLRALQGLSECLLGLTLDRATMVEWLMLLRRGLAEALVYILFDRYFCGFSKEELIACASTDESEVQYYMEEVLPYFSLVLHNLRDFLGFSLTCCHNSSLSPEIRKETMSHADRLLRELPRLWQNLWDIRTPFLDSQPANIMIDQPNAITAPRTLHHGLTVSIKLVIGFYHGFGTSLTPLPGPTLMPHVALIVWVHCYHKMDRQEALTNARFAVTHYRSTQGKSAMPNLYSKAVAGSTSYKQIAQAVLRDLKTKHDIRGAVFDALEIICSLRPTQAPFFSMAEPCRRRLLRGCIAASLSLVCMHETVDIAASEDALSNMFTFLRWSLMDPNGYPGGFPERQLHAIIAVICAFLVQGVDQQKIKLITEAMMTVKICCTLFNNRNRGAISDTGHDGQLDLARRRSRAAWQVVTDQLRSRGTHRHAQWKSLHTGLTLLGRALAVGEDGTEPVGAEDVHSAAPFLARCNWHECLCSVHAPLHKLQICRGCTYVAYCNDICQRDWADGGHGARCGKTTSNKRRKAIEMPITAEALYESSVLFS